MTQFLSRQITYGWLGDNRRVIGWDRRSQLNIASCPTTLVTYSRLYFLDPKFRGTAEWQHNCQCNSSVAERVFDCRCFLTAFIEPARGDGLAQWLERWTQYPKVEGSNFVRSTRKTLIIFRVKKVALIRCRCIQPPCVYTQA